MFLANLRARLDCQRPFIYLDSLETSQYFDQLMGAFEKMRAVLIQQPQIAKIKNSLIVKKVTSVLEPLEPQIQILSKIA